MRGSQAEGGRSRGLCRLLAGRMGGLRRFWPRGTLDPHPWEEALPYSSSWPRTPGWGEGAQPGPEAGCSHSFSKPLPGRPRWCPLPPTGQRQ